ncbi:MAG: MraY family glycosyltransferase [Gammaproteobacteria bacterium]
MTTVLVMLSTVSIAASILTGFIRRYALAANLLDTPNQRSSHVRPTPRGGGLAIVIVFLLGLPVLNRMGWLDHESLWAISGAGAWVALIGFLDDHRHIPARWRLLAHFIAAGWGLFWLGGAPPFYVFGHSFELGWLGHLLVLFYLVWLLNLYNFMDGIDGLAGIEAITVGLGGALLYTVTGESRLLKAPLLLSASAAGFLLWNFPPARIFMGDVGSGFLGIVLGLFSLQAAAASPPLFWSWLILLGFFIVDATLTLFRRFIRGEEVHEAHRCHAYQNASRHYGAHKPVTVAAGMINVCWLTPLALAVGVGRLDGLAGLVLAYFPLVLLAIRFGAGEREAGS